MAKRKRSKKPTTSRCKNVVVHRANDDCRGRKGANACHPDYVKVGKSKYTAKGKRVGAAGPWQRASKVAVCKVGRKMVAVTPGSGATMPLRRLGR